MNHDNDNNKTAIDHTLERSADAPVPPEVEARLRTRLAGFRQKLESDANAQPSHNRHWILRTAVGVAACLALAVALWLTLLGGGQQTIAAQVIAAIGNIEKMHLSMQSFRDGKPYSQQELWYQRGVGYVVHETIGGRLTTTIDDGEYSWSYTPDSQFVAKVVTYRDINDPSSFNLDKMQLSRLLRFDPQRDPTGDKTVGDEVWQLYIVDKEGNTGRFWIDSNNLIRAVEAQKKHDDYVETFTAEVDYDIKIDPLIFKPDLPDNARVVGPRDYVGQLYDLDSAIFKQEMHGQVFAVHKLERLEDKWAYMITSTRMTEGNRRQLGIDHPWHYFGGNNLQAQWGRIHEEPIGEPMLIASMKIGDLIVKWHLLGERYQDRLERCDISITMIAANELAALLGDDDWVTGRFDLDLAIPQEPGDQTLEGLLASIHAEGLRLAPIMHYFQVFEKKHRDPRHYSEQDYIANIKKRVEYNQ